MSQSPTGTTFKLRTPAHIKSCHLVGSWDNYGKRYNMAADTAAGAGWWKLTLKFSASGAVQRFWYYYVLDGYFESHDPNKPTCKEPTRGITLNILDCGVSSPAPSSAGSWSPSSSNSSRFPSPSSSVSPVSTSSGKSYCSRPTISDPVRKGSNALSSRSQYSHRGPSPRRNSPPPARPASHIIQPTPHNPLTRHKLTLDTSCRPISTITDAATTSGDSPISASSSRSASSFGSCSCSSGSTVFSEDSPTTPVCHCGFESGCESEGESCCSEESYEDPEYRRIRVSRRASYHPTKVSHDGQLPYEFERRLRM